jgi:hypothetical protein
MEVGDEVLLEITIRLGVIGNAMMPEFVRQPSLDGAEGGLAVAASLRWKRQDLVDPQSPTNPSHVARRNP